MRRGNILENLIDFGALLRAHGLQVHTGRLIDVAQALQHVDLGSREEVFHTCRTLLVHRHEDFAAFDTAFDAVLRTCTGASDATVHRCIECTRCVECDRSSDAPSTRCA